jgi:hypothetical protein
VIDFIVASITAFESARRRFEQVCTHSDSELHAIVFQEVRRTHSADACTHQRLTCRWTVSVQLGGHAARAGDRAEFVLPFAQFRHLGIVTPDGGMSRYAPSSDSLNGSLLRCGVVVCDIM